MIGQLLMSSLGAILTEKLIGGIVFWIVVSYIMACVDRWYENRHKKNKNK